MPTMSPSCFVCGRPSVLSYDYFVLENHTTTESSAKLTQHHSQEVASGIIRVTVCGDCLMEQAHTYLAANTKENGAPKMLSKKEVPAVQHVLAQMQNGWFQPADGITQHLFSQIFNPTFYFMEKRNINMRTGVDEMSLGLHTWGCLDLMKNKDNLTLSERASPQVMEWATKQKTPPPVEVFSPRFKRLMAHTIEAPYVLWSAAVQDARPYAYGIESKINTGNENVPSKFYCTPMGKIKDSMSISDDMKPYAMSMEAYYFQYLVNV